MLYRMGALIITRPTLLPSEAAQSESSSSSSSSSEQPVRLVPVKQATSSALDAPVFRIPKPVSAPPAPPEMPTNRRGEVIIEQEPPSPRRRGGFFDDDEQGDEGEGGERPECSIM